MANGTDINIDRDFLNFLTERIGGHEKAELAFRRHVIRTALEKNLSSLPMGEVLDLIADRGWMDWMRGLCVTDFVGLLPVSSAKRIVKATGERQNGERLSEQERINGLMIKFNKNPWLSLSDIAIIWGLASDRVYQITEELVQNGTLQRHQVVGGNVMFSRADETTPPPL